MFAKRKTAKLLAATAMALSVLTVQAWADPLSDAFKSPPVEAKPRLRWWWPGDAVTDAELRREVQLMKETGFGGAEVQSFSPNFVTLTPEERAVVNDYAELSFFAHLRAAADAAKSAGLSLDYTFGSAWPSGGGEAIPPEKAFTELAMARTAVKGGTSGAIKVELPKRTKRLGALNFFDPRVKDPKYADWGKRLDARARTVAVIAMKGSAPDLKKRGGMNGMTISPWSDVLTSGTLDPASRVVLTDKLREDGTLDWTPPPGDWQVFVFRQFASDVSVLGAAGRGPQLVLDHTDPAAFAAHAARVGDPLGKNPSGMRSTFVDSLELMQDIQWGPKLLEEFKKRRGYDLTPYLPFVLQPGWAQAWDEHYSPPYFEAANSDLAERVRADYRRTVSDMMIAGFIEPFVAWNHAHGLKAKFQAHGGAFDIIRGYGLADIPETEDLVHSGDPLFMRLARSAANLYGRRIVSAESLVWSDRAYSVTPGEMRRRIDLIMAGGVNSMILHGMNYRFHADDWPGWHAFQPSAFSLGFSGPINETNPVWPAMKPLAAYMGRLQAVMQAGEPVVPVAWFYGRYGYYIGIEDDGAGKQAGEKAFMAAGYDFDRINPDSIAQAKIEGRRLISKGGHSYGMLALPSIDGIRADTMEAIAGFAQAGLPVFFTDHAPRRDEGLADAKARDARVKKAVAAAMKAGAKIVPAAQLPEAIRAAGVAGNLRFEGDASDIVFVQRVMDGQTVTFIHNRADAARNLTVSLLGVGGVTRWDAMDGSITPVTASAAADMTRVPLSLSAGESALLVLDPKSRPQSVAAPTVVGSAALPADGWALSVSGHVARKPYAHDFGKVALQDWSKVPELAGFSGEASYSRSITVDPAWLKQGARVTLDLGQIYDMATVTVNGRTLPPVIAPPFRIDVTDALRPGPNMLKVVVANVPQNGMIDAGNAAFKKLKPVAAGWAGAGRLEASP